MHWVISLLREVLTIIDALGEIGVVLTIIDALGEPSTKGSTYYH